MKGKQKPNSKGQYRVNYQPPGSKGQVYIATSSDPYEKLKETSILTLKGINNTTHEVMAGDVKFHPHFKPTN